MSHPVGISRQCRRTISRTRRRMRLRTTAPPIAFLILKPNRLSGNSFAFRKTVKWELVRRFPERYTASNSAFRTNLPAAAGLPALPGPAALAARPSRGHPCPPLFGREAMTSLLAACRQHLAPARRFHPGAKPVRLRAPPLARLISPFWQSNPPLSLRVAPEKSYPEPRLPPLAAFTPTRESTSLLARRGEGQANAGIAYREGKSDTPDYRAEHYWIAQNANCVAILFSQIRFFFTDLCE